jgi:hypothetical protein
LNKRGIVFSFYGDFGIILVFLQYNGWKGLVNHTPLSMYWGRFGFDREEVRMLACSALYGEHFKLNVHTLIGENNYALAA